MIQFDFNALLKTMDKAGIMAMVEKEVDKVIAANQAAKEVEQERYKIAKANVDCDNYSLDDLIILEEARLKKVAKKKAEEAKSIPADTIKAGKMPKHPIRTKPVIMSPEEFIKFLDTSIEGNKNKKYSEKTTYDGRSYGPGFDSFF